MMLHSRSCQASAAIDPQAGLRAGGDQEMNHGLPIDPQRGISPPAGASAHQLAAGDIDTGVVHRPAARQLHDAGRGQARKRERIEKEEAVGMGVIRVKRRLEGEGGLSGGVNELEEEDNRTAAQEKMQIERTQRGVCSNVYNFRRS